MGEAHYRCCRCGLEWDQAPSQDPRSRGSLAADPCAFCGSLYCVWVNYADFALRKGTN